MANERQLRLKTEGGPDPKVELDPCDQILLELLESVNKKSMSGLTNAIDSDSDFTIPVPSPSVIEQQYVFIDANDDMENLLDVTESSEAQSGELLGGFEKFTSNGDNNNNDTRDHLFWKKATDLKRKIDPALQSNSKNDTPDHLFWKKATDLKRKIDRALQSNSKVPKKVPRRMLYPSHVSHLKFWLRQTVQTYITLCWRQVLVQKQIEKIDVDITFERTKHKLEIELMSLEVAKENKEVLQ